MIIKDININNFGKLSDLRITPADGLNIIYAPNESGKTSLMSFVKYIFYGTKQKKQSGDLSFKERYTPWSGLSMGGSLELESQGGRYIVQRTEQNSISKLSVFNLSSGEKEDKIQNAGIYFMGMGEKAFSDSSYISDIHSIRSSAGDGEILSKLLDNSTNKKTYSRIRDELNERQLQICSVKRKNSSVSLIDAELRQNEERLHFLDNRIDDLNKKAVDADRVQNRIDILAKEQNKLKDFQNYNAKLPKQQDDLSLGNGRKYPYLLFAIFLSAISVMLFMFSKSFALCEIFGDLAIFASLEFYFLAFKKHRLKNRQSDIETNTDNAEKQLGNTKLELNLSDDDIKSFTNCDIDDIMKDNEEEIKELMAESAVIKHSLSELGTLSLEREVVVAEIQRLLQKKEEILKKAEIIGIALDILNNAFADVKDDIFPDVCKKTLDIYSYITNSSCELVSSDESFALSYAKDGFVRDALSLSKGSMDILYFSLRLSILDSVDKDGESIPLFMDDIFASCDDGRAFRILDMLLKISKNNQIFLFTCRSREGEYFKDNEEVKIFNGLKG